MTTSLITICYNSARTIKDTLKSEFYYRVAVIAEPLILYRRHGKNVSGGGSQSQFGAIMKVKFRVYALLMLGSRLLAR